MFLRQIFKTNRKSEADHSSLGNDRIPYTSNVTTGPSYTNLSHTLSGRDTVMQPESSLTDTLRVSEADTTQNYIYYRIYAEDGAIPLKAPVEAGDPFLGRIKARSVPPPDPGTAKAVRRSIARVENIKDRESTSLFLTPYSPSPMEDGDEITILDGTGPGSTPQEPLALVAKMSDSERSALESDGRSGLSGLESDARPVTSTTVTAPEIQYLYYLLYADDYEMPSKVAINPKEPSLGRIRADSIAPPLIPASIKRCIARAERNPALVWHSDLFADTSCKTPLEEDHISILRTDGPGLNPKKPMAIVQRRPIPLADGLYVIKNREANIYWATGGLSSITTVYFYTMANLKDVKKYSYMQWNITNDTNGNISIISPNAPSSWVGAEIEGSTVPVPWRLIPVDGKFYYLTTEMDRASQNPRVPAARPQKGQGIPGSMATLKEGDQWQMWEFIRI